jgi:hypothetical protein
MGVVKSLLERLNNIGFERTRRAVAALGLSLFVFLFLVLALLMWLNGQTAWVPSFIALSLAYAVAFMGVAAEWFWGRWFAAGLAWSGLITGVAVLFQLGEWNPVLGTYGILHGLVVLMLSGAKMAERYELQPAWRERYGMDEFGVARLRKTVTRASASLPSVILYFLAPKEPGQGLVVAALGALGVLAAVGGLRGLVHLRTWGVAALGVAVASLLGGGFASLSAPASEPLVVGAVPRFFSTVALPPDVSATLAFVGAAVLAAACLPFLAPAVRFVRARR